MKRSTVFGYVMGSSALTLVLVVFWYVFEYHGGGSSIGAMMGQMMGTPYADATSSLMPEYVWLAVAGLIVLVALGAVGFVYYLAVPQISTNVPLTRQMTSVSEPARAKGAGEGSYLQDWATLMRTSKPDEKQVLEVLAAHQGIYLQKFIVKEAHLSKLKTHRILSRFVERGVVTAERKGNTNEISLATWLLPAPVKS